jgi:gas vesicle protein
MYRDDQSGAGFVLGMLTGAFVGAGLALLFAPKSGWETRQQLGEQYRGLAERVGEQAENWRSTAAQLRDQGRERIQQMTGQLSDRSSSAAERQGVNQPAQTGFPSSAPSV